MVNQEFIIDVKVVPKTKGIDQTGKRLDVVEKQASELRQELVAALSVRDQGVQASLMGINATLVRSERLAENTQRAIFQIGEDIDSTGLREARDELDETKRSAVGLGGVLGGLFAGITVGFLIREFAQLADESTNLRNRLRLVTDSEEELIATQERLFQIARATRSELGATATIFQRLALRGDELGRSNQELLQFTESLNQAITLSGATSVEAAAGLIQLSQGLAAGALRGDEFRSVSEQLPVILQTISEQTGLTANDLRELSREGKLSADLIIDSFAGARVELAERFAESVPTISSAFVVLRNEILQTVGSLDQATGGSELFARGVILASENVEALAVAVVGLGGAVLVAAGVAFPAATAAVAAFIVAAGPLIAVAAAGAAVVIAIKRIAGEANAFDEVMTQLEEDSKFIPALGSQITNAQREINLVNRQIEAQRRRGVDAAESQIATIQRLQNAIRAARGEVMLEAEANEEAAAAKKQNSEAAQGVLDALREEATLLQLTASERAISEEITRRTNELKAKDIDLTDERLTSLREEIEGLIRSNAEQERLNAALQRVKGPAEEYKQLLADLAALQERGAISQEELNAAVERFKPKSLKQEEADPFTRQVESLRQANEQLQIRADNEGLFETFLLEQNKLRQEGVELTLLQKIELFGVVSQQEILNEALRKQKREEQAIAKARRDADRLADREGKRIDRLRAQIDVQGELAAQIEEINRLFGDEVEIAEQVDATVEGLRLRQLDASKELAAGFERAFIRIKQEAEDLAAVGEEIVNVFADRATDALIEFARTGEFEFKKFANAVLEDIVRILIRLLVVQAISAAISGGSSLVTSIGLGAAQGPGRQGGGTVQPGQAPFPVGEEGEELFVPNRTGTIVPNAASVAQPPPVVNVQVVTVESMDMVPQAIASGIATESIIQELGNNKDRVNQVLA